MRLMYSFLRTTQGDIIIDDRDAHGVKEFKGTWIQFGSPEYKTWDQVLALLGA